MREILSTPTVTISTDERYKIIQICWNGLISEHDLIEALVVVKENLYEQTNLIVNRSELLDFDTDARKWILHVLMRRESRHLVPYLSKLATVESKNKVRIFSAIINQLGSFIFPKLSLMSFEDTQQALNWAKKTNQSIDRPKEVHWIRKKIFKTRKPEIN